MGQAGRGLGALDRGKAKGRGFASAYNWAPRPSCGGGCRRHLEIGVLALYLCLPLPPPPGEGAHHTTSAYNLGGSRRIARTDCKSTDECASKRPGYCYTATREPPASAGMCYRVRSASNSARLCANASSQSALSGGTPNSSTSSRTKSSRITRPVGKWAPHSSSLWIAVP